MARAALRRRLTWQRAEVAAVTRESARAFRLSIRPPEWPGHLPGQHLDVRLTAVDGYTAQRSYSIASPPERPGVDLVVERLEDGEVSPYLTDVLRPGDPLAVRGPIGGYFVWPYDGVATAAAAPVQLVAGGSGVVPFLAMLGHHRATGSAVEVRLLYSARTLEDVIGRAELDASGAAVSLTLTRAAPAGWTGLTGRVDRAMLGARTIAPARGPRVLVCGPTAFVEAVAGELVAMGHDPGRVRTERFGATGGPA
ncbi:ferredoxin reductase [Georgenia sp. AZ-5]|uniref:ferredoxin reductase n=1 Tax=Georgenia sp. AZ-5 TaxID=3367526 RepID=UPI003754627E